MPQIFPSLLVIIVPALASIILFLRIKLNHVSYLRDLFWHYALGFLLTSFLGFPSLLVNLGTNISRNQLLVIYAISGFAIFISYLLFYRGTVLLITRDRFLTTMLPLIFLPMAAAFSMVALFYLKLSTIMIYTAMAWGFLFVNDHLLSIVFLYSFASGSPFKIMNKKPCALILSIGWFLILGLDVSLWIVAASYHPELWILKVSSLTGWFLVRSFAYFVILAGVLSCAKCLESSITRKED